MFFALVIVTVGYYFILRKRPGTHNSKLTKLATTNRSIKTVIMIFLAPVLVLFLSQILSTGPKTAEGDGAILWLYLPLLPVCGIALVALIIKKTSLKRNKEQEN